MRARDIMTTSVQYATPNARVQKIAQAMVRHRISAVPVIDKNRRVIGIVSEADLLHRVESGTIRKRSWWLDMLIDDKTRAREYAKARGLYARDVMTSPVISVKPDTEISEIADIMERSAVKRVPVVDAENRMVGIVSRRDLIAAVAKPPRKSPRFSDAAIGAALQHEITAKTNTFNSAINIAVAKGVVELSGLVASSEELDAVRVMAETIPGVRAVKDRMTVRPNLRFAS
ncbi:MAG: CBS domain-containing protein [Planctomycetes bacterium]|nr:CBS domain-containing protein [Planctomycetota bacterium]